MFGFRDNYAQGCSPPKNGGADGDPNPIKLIVSPAGTSLSGTFIAPAAGRYQFALSGAAGWGAVGMSGGPGSLAIRVVRLAKGQGVPYLVSRGSAATGGGAAVSSTVTFTDRVMTAGFGSDRIDNGDGTFSNGTGGVASGGDVNVNGTFTTQGASFGQFTGGVQGTPPGSPGAPGDPNGGPGGSGRLIVTYIGP